MCAILPNTKHLYSVHRAKKASFKDNEQIAELLYYHTYRMTHVLFVVYGIVESNKCTFISTILS